MSELSSRTLYLASEECDRPELPVAFDVVRLLRVDSMPGKAAVIHTSHPVYRDQVSDFVVLVKGNEAISDVYEGASVGVFLLPLDARAGDDALDLSTGLQPVQDWCSVFDSLDAALRWQVRV